MKRCDKGVLLEPVAALGTGVDAVHGVIGDTEEDGDDKHSSYGDLSPVEITQGGAQHMVAHHYVAEHCQSHRQPHGDRVTGDDELIGKEHIERPS